ncbi:hypothetical protein [Bacillus haynesii]|uniref:hypothetical protein n=1 Tax=Bacillus haynesii TaxID=1925021 RepID=UPI00227E0BD7|nr:hypothetical protein [Bacillus haynesii]MCY8216317.1 hypothetical protein [Bacillus haynesii]MCY8577469.1 hypothetical protein [Bacillus haynesii]MCY8610895.1 hypothetical protein [Bacillus haynesii]MCY8642934.1 hypothetical protein [Bacillus haynesii]MCY8668261.1 hypothetical protein [Bacillus haynesii]
MQSERGRQNQEQDQGVWLAGEEDRSEMRFAVYTPSNATSNRIYQAIGYRPVADSIAYAFHEKQPNRSL